MQRRRKNTMVQQRLCGAYDERLDHELYEIPWVLYGSLVAPLPSCRPVLRSRQDSHTFNTRRESVTFLRGFGSTQFGQRDCVCLFFFSFTVIFKVLVASDRQRVPVLEPSCSVYVWLQPLDPRSPRIPMFTFHAGSSAMVSQTNRSIFRVAQTFRC